MKKKFILYFEKYFRSSLFFLFISSPSSIFFLQNLLFRLPTVSQVSVVVSILISSDFLKMRRLVDECLAFMGGNLTEIVKLPIDLSCLSDKIIVQLAKVSKPPV